MDPPQKIKANKTQYLQFIYNHPAWQKQIKTSLQKLHKKQLPSKNIIDTLIQFYYLSYTHRQLQNRRKYNITFRQLYKQYNKQLPQIFSNIAGLILQYQQNVPKLHMLLNGNTQNNQIKFNKKQILLLICLMSVCLICNQDIKFKRKFPNLAQFSFIFSQQDYKTTTVIQYIKGQFIKLQKDNQNYHKQYIILRRLSQNRTIQQIITQNKDKPILQVKIAQDKQSIQQFYGQIKVDFANKFIGGGALGAGCVQQQIMFSNHPQMFTTVLFCEVMRQNQAIQLIGYKKYFNNYGYAHTTGYDGPDLHKYQYQQGNIAKQYVVAIDALHYPSKKHSVEFSIQNFNRQLMKAYVGFSKSEPKDKSIVSGNWGCGAFNGDLHLKFIIQWLACSMAGKQLIYCPFGFKSKLINEKVFGKLRKMTVGEIYKIIIESEEQFTQEKNIYRLLDQMIK